MKPACCFCDTEFPTWEGLADHVCTTDCGYPIINGKRPMFLLRRSGNQIVCWCGKTFGLRRKLYRAQTMWAAHMETVGGLANHILELTIGEQHG